MAPGGAVEGHAPVITLPLPPARAARLLVLAARRVGTLRVHGGPGSGNFGHAGRPGEVGGSAPGGGSVAAGRQTMTQMRLGLPGEEPRTTTREFAERLGAKGYRTLERVEDLPPRVRSDLHVEGSADLPMVAVEGIEQGLADLEARSPGLSEMVKQGVELGNMSFSEEAGDQFSAVAVTSFTTDGRATMLFNGRFSAEFDEYAKQDGWKPNVPVLMAAGRQGEDMAREMFRGTVMHEVGHVADAAMKGAFSDSTTVELLMHFNGDNARITDFVTQNLSPYAATGPAEAAAELFTNVIYDRPIPRELANTASLMRRALSFPYGGKP